VHWQPVHRPASGEAPAGREGKRAHGGEGENAAPKALEPHLSSTGINPNHEAQQRTLLGVTSSPCTLKTPRSG